MTTTTLITPALQKGFDITVDMFGQQMADYAAPFVARSIPTTALNELILMTSTLGPLVPIAEAGGVPKDDKTIPYNFRVTTKTYASSVDYTVEMELSDWKNLFASYTQDFIRAQYWARQQAFADWINYATDTSSQWATFDGKPLAATDHPRADGQTMANRPGTASSLSYFAVEQGMQEMLGHVSWRNQPYPLDGQVRLLVGRQDSMVAQRIYATDKVAGSADNDKNVISSQMGAPVVSPYLTQNGRWCLFKAGSGGCFAEITKSKKVNLSEGMRQDQLAKTVTAYSLFAFFPIRFEHTWINPFVRS